MRFKDIEQFTRMGTYQINVSLPYLKSAIEDYKETYNLQMNPDFQRGNVWTREQKIAYVEFFLKGGKTARTIYFNCPAFGRLDPKTDIPDMVLVDGLQRLTAMLDFLDNKLPIFGDNYFKDFEDSPRMVGNDFLFNVNDLQYRRDVLKWYIDMNSGGTVHSTEEIQRVQSLLDEEINKDKEDLCYE